MASTPNVHFGSKWYTFRPRTVHFHPFTLDLTTLILVAYINGIVERFGMGNYVLVVPGFSGQYVLPFIFSQDPQIDTGHNLSGLITISPGSCSFIWVQPFQIGQELGHFSKNSCT